MEVLALHQVEWQREQLLAVHRQKEEEASREQDEVEEVEHSISGGTGSLGLSGE